MDSSSPAIRKAAVLGAGVMGAQIAAHFVNVGVPVVLFDLPAGSGDPNAIAAKGVAALAKLDPAPLAAKELAANIDVANYGSDLPRLADCDLVVEAIAERIDWKRDLYAKVAPHLGSHAILATNTSGLSLAALSEALPPALRARFCGVHFFNPPRYMHLVELVPAPAAAPALLDALETFLTTTLGKGVVRAKDTPNFIANRIGVFSILATMLHAERFGLSFDVVDTLTGPAIGRPKSASFRTVDVVGLDTTAHVIGTMRDGLPDDPWHRHFAVPPALAALVAKGALGQKSGAGFYRKQGREIQVLDPGRGEYRLAAGEMAPEVAAILAADPKERLTKLRASSHPQARFLWSIFRDVFHYAAYHLASIADNARDVDLALRWGFGWQAGPFETWQASGWTATAEAIAEDIAAGRALADVPLPGWVDGAAVREAGGVHAAHGAFAPADDAFRPRASLPVYRRQAFPDPLPNERRDRGATVFETDALRLWHLGDDIAIASFKTKGHTISDAVLEGLLRACDEAERAFAALVLWQPREPFSFGADLQAIAPAIKAGHWASIESNVAKFQQTALRLRYALVPTVAAVRGMALGGSCEFIMHCDRAVAALESYPGLVEAGVGILPAGGGSKELALRAADEARRGAVGSQLDMFPFLRAYFQTVATASVAKSALEAKSLGYLRPADVVVAHQHEILHVAKSQARALAEAGYRPPLAPRGIPVAGRTGIATLQMMLVNMREGGFVSAHDYEVGLAIARVMCGGDVDSGSLVDERWLLALEREEFMRLLATEKTQARIAHTLATGKPLRN
jgi:3-hydroxyacyl-CoA dehydrogenase